MIVLWGRIGGIDSFSVLARFEINQRGPQCSVFGQGWVDDISIPAGCFTNPKYPFKRRSRAVLLHAGRSAASAQTTAFA
jgi:hypothetical protein